MRRIRNGIFDVIMLLNWLPRYGRVYTFPQRGDAAFSVKNFEKSWKYQKYGCWGINILDNLFPKQFSHYIDDRSVMS